VLKSLPRDVLRLEEALAIHDKNNSRPGLGGLIFQSNSAARNF